MREYKEKAEKGMGIDSEREKREELMSGSEGNCALDLKNKIVSYCNKAFCCNIIFFLLQQNILL